MLAQPGHPPAVYFVDDNFIGNRKATREMLPHLSRGRSKHGYPLQFACEATLNIAKQTEILELMREAQFVDRVRRHRDAGGRRAQGACARSRTPSLPMLESIETLNSYGLEVTSGIILGLDTDTADTESRLIDFIELSKIPILTINLLQALPKTPLWDRLQRDGRLIVDDPALESNVRFLRPYDEVVATWRRCIAHAYEPERLFARFFHQVDADLRQPHDRSGARQAHLRQSAAPRGAGVQHRRFGSDSSDYRRPFWRAARHALPPRPDRRGVRHRLRRLPPDRVLPRGAARRAERLVLFDASARAAARVAAGAQVGINS